MNQLTKIDEHITLDGFSIHVIGALNEDNKDTIIFLHDSLGCNALWRSFPSKLASAVDANWLSYDRVGYGQSSAMPSAKRADNYLESEADFLMKLLAKYNLNNPILFGHSDGGSIAIIAAAKHPSKIKAIITEGAHVFVEDITLEGIELAKEQYEHSNLPERLAQYHGTKTQTLFEAWTETWLSPSFRNWNIEHFLPNITCPTLVMQGTEDEYGSQAQVSSIATKVNGLSQVFMVANARHSPHKQCEDFVITTCSAFLRKI